MSPENISGILFFLDYASVWMKNNFIQLSITKAEYNNQKCPNLCLFASHISQNLCIIDV